MLVTFISLENTRYLQLKEGDIYLAHGFREFSPWLAGSEAEMA